jgi:serralysin
MPQLLLAGSALAEALPSLTEAITCLEARLSIWASNAGDYDALLRQVFATAGTDAAAWSQRADALREQLVSTGLSLSLEILPTSQQRDLLGAYSPASPGGGEVVYLHPSWLKSASAAQIEAVLLEELGHAIDCRLNGPADSTGDEGEMFSALLRGETPNPGAYNENDQRLITIAGNAVTVEAATLSLDNSVTRLTTRSSTYSGNPSIDALLQPRTLTAPAPIRYFFPDNSLLSSAADPLNQGAWALDSLQQDQFRQVIAEWSSVALVDPQEVSSLNQASITVYGISHGNSNVLSINGSPVHMQFIPDAGPFQAGGFETGTIIHEMGHALGLKHPFEGRDQLSGEENGLRYTMMAYDSWYDKLGQFVEPTTPQLYDIRAIQYLYGANTAYRSGNDTYQWGSDDIVFRCLWDGGGRDTINAANQAQFVQINLNPGSFSVIGRAIFHKTFVEDPNGNVTLTTTSTVNGVTTVVTVRGNDIESNRRDNLSIAYGTVIENAIGSAFSDRLQGNAAANRLTGGGGNDTLIGGAGNDVYLFDADLALGIDTINEAGGGSDSLDFTATSTRTITLNLGLATAQVVNANLSLNLGSVATVENVIGGALADTLIGNILANSLTGGGGNDTLSGGGGNDTLIGGAGADRFRFATALNATTNRDAITDFSLAQGDRIELENAVFTALLTAGPLAASAFFIGAAATNTSQRIRYDATSGFLLYDSDGNGAAAAVAFAALTPGLALTHTSFSIT